MSQLQQPDDPAEDPLVESMLEEMIGGVTPPDLKMRILERHAQRLGLSVPLANPAVTSNDSSRTQRSIDLRGLQLRSDDTTSLYRKTQRSTRGWLRWTSWACGVVASCCIGWFAWSHYGPSSPRETAQRPVVLPPATDDSGRSTDKSSSSSTEPLPANNPTNSTHDSREPSTTSPIDPAIVSNELPLPNIDPNIAIKPQSQTSPDAGRVNPSLEPADLALESATDPAAATPTPLSDEEVIAAINAHLHQSWQQVQVAPATPVSDEVWCVRVYERLIGRSPSRNELRDFTRDSAADKRTALVNRLLAHPDTRRDYVRHWSRLWSTWLVGNRPETRSFQTGLRQYWNAALAEQRSYDRVIVELATALGSNVPEAPDYNPATNYVLAHWNASGSQLASDLCRIGLGQRVGCAQCHDDKLSQWTQEKFWQLAANFAPLQTQPIRPGKLRLVIAEKRTETKYQSPNGEWHAATPHGIDGRPLSTGEPARDALAAQLARHPQMARAVVNRLWSSLLTYGFTLPIDDMGTHNPATHPDLVALLEQQFIAHDYQIEPVLRWIVLSEPFSHTASFTAANMVDFPDGGAPAQFSRFYERRPLLFTSTDQGLQWLASGKQPQVIQGTAENRDLVAHARRERTFAKTSEDRTKLGQTNGPMGQLLPVRFAAQARSFSTNALTREQQLEHAFRMIVGREPSAEELSRTASIYDASSNEPTIALERVMWALINSPDSWTPLTEGSEPGYFIRRWAYLAWLTDRNVSSDVLPDVSCRRWEHGDCARTIVVSG